MIKQASLVVSLCLTALLISSCSDGGTESGVHEQAVLTSTECTGEDRGPCGTVSSTLSGTSPSSNTESVGEDRDYAGTSRSSAGLLPLPYYKGTISVTSPNGGESWNVGDTRTISWSSSSEVTSSVNIRLQEDWSIPGVGNGRRTEATIASSAPNTGSYSWTIPSSVSIGDQYIIQIQEAVDVDRASDTSDGYFSISGGVSDPTVSLSCSPGSASESGGVFTCTVSLSHSSTKNVTVNVSYSGSATGGTDWNTPNHAFGSPIGGGTLEISAGQTSTSWTFSGVSDSDTEGNETIVVDISTVTNGTESGTQKETLTLTDVVSASDPTVTMSCSDSKNHMINGVRYSVVQCTFTLSKTISNNVTVNLAYSGTATSGTDYNFYGSGGTNVTINAGQTSTTSSLIKYRPDAGQGNNKTFIVDIGSVTNANESGVQRATLTLSSSATTTTTTGTTTTGTTTDTATTTSTSCVDQDRGPPKCTTTTTPTGTTTAGTTTTGTTTTGTTTSTDGLPADDYEYLCKHNECSKHSNRTMRWSSKTINVYTRYPFLYSGIQGSWPVTFNLGAGGGITLEAGIGDWCGVAVPEKWTDGTIRGCRVRINILHRELNCGSLKATVIHEIGHCIGFFEHTTDGGLMDATANNATGTNPTIRNMISLLYSLPPGTDVSSRLRSYSRKGGYTYSRNNPQKLPPKVYYKPIRD